MSLLFTVLYKAFVGKDHECSMEGSSELGRKQQPPQLLKAFSACASGESTIHTFLQCSCLLALIVVIVKPRDWNIRLWILGEQQSEEQLVSSREREREQTG